MAYLTYNVGMVMVERRPLVEGIGVATVSPFSKDGKQLNLDDDYSNYINYLLRTERKVRALYGLGWTGEGANMTIDERQIVAHFLVREVNRRVPVIIHVGGTKTTEEAVELAIDAQVIGADAISSIPPETLDGSPPTLEATTNHYSQIAQATDLPFYAYWRTESADKTTTAAEFLKAMSRVPNFAGIKYTDHKLGYFQELVELSGGSWNALTGPDDEFLSGLSHKSDGAIGSTYNLTSRHCNDNIYEIYRNYPDRLQDAKRAQEEANQVISLLERPDIGVIPGIKAILEWLGFPTGPSRQYGKLSNEAQSRLLRAITPNKHVVDLMDEHIEKA